MFTVTYTYSIFFLTNVRYILLIFALCFVQFWGKIFSVNVSWCNGVLGWSAVVSANVTDNNHFTALIFIIFFWGRATKSPKCHNTVDVCLWTMMHCFVQYVSYCSYKRFITMKLISTCCYCCKSLTADWMLFPCFVFRLWVLLVL